MSHQSASKPFQGEHRTTVQSKAFGATVAAVADSPNHLHGAKAVFAHSLAVAHIVTHAIVDNEIAFENAAGQTEFKTDRFYSGIMKDDQSAKIDEVVTADDSLFS